MPKKPKKYTKRLSKNFSEKPEVSAIEKSKIANPTFEESLDFINNEINKRRNKWNLTILAWIDYEDVAQILRIHICKKWHLYDPARPLGPWINRVISSQTKNLIRNNYGNYCRPCLKCAAAEGDNGCSIYNKQCAACPLFSNWEKTKKSAYDTKLPVSLELHTQEVHNQTADSIDIEKSAQNIHNKMRSVLKPFEYRIYECLYISHKTEEETAKIMGYITNEKGRKAGYRQIINTKKVILEKVKKCLNEGEIDII